jgi:hypothetical protein
VCSGCRDGLATFTFLILIGDVIAVSGVGWVAVKMLTITLVVVDTWTSTLLRPKAGTSEATRASM